MTRVGSGVLLAGVLLFAACGGGGGAGAISGGGGVLPTPTPTPCPAGYSGTAPNCTAFTTTTASGTVVNDKTGAPLPAQKVTLMPWGPCGPTPAPATSITPSSDGCPTPLPSPQVTTDPNGNFTLGGVPNGHYIVVIGNDVTNTPPPGYAPPTCTTNCGTPTPAPFVVQAVVHDNVTLTGGNQTLHAPTLPAVPTITPAPWETNGSYRLATLDASTEMPCYIAWEYERALHGLAGASVDEWVMEDVRAVNKARQNQPGSYSLLINAATVGAGGTSCNNVVDTQVFATNPVVNSHGVDPRTLWFSGQWMLFEASGTNFYQGVGLAEFPIDPRASTDPNQPTWP